MSIAFSIDRKESMMSKAEKISNLALQRGAMSPARAKSTKASLQGAWKLKSFHTKFADGTEYCLPGNVTGSQIKMFSGKHVLFVGHFVSKDKSLDNYGGGVYSLKGDEYIETLQYDGMKELVGKTHHLKLTIKGKILTQTGPVDPEEQRRLGQTLTEVYEKMD
jgi:hypothetical protein